MNTISTERMHDLRALPLAIRLKRLRCLSGYSQKDIAERLDTSQNTISLWERGKYIPSGKYLERIIELYQLPYDFFVDMDISGIERKDS